MSSQDGDQQEQDRRTTLAPAAAEEVRKVHGAVVEQFLHPATRPANVAGVGVGIKWKGGEPTGEPALLVLVSKKVPKEHLNEADLIPPTLHDMQTDVLAVGYPMAGGGCSVRPAAHILARRTRPVKGGFSVGHYAITAGTIATCVYDILPGGSTNPPSHGVGTAKTFYILSNNHVLANVNDGSPGDAILQPGPIDGGICPDDQVGVLSRFVPIDMQPPTALADQQNVVDCALAEGSIGDLDRGIFWAGEVRGWRPKANVTVGTVVRKTGRTTCMTTGRITAVSVTIDINYGSGRLARFSDQIITTNMSAGGDSGSLITTLDGVAVGLLFAGSNLAMLANQIENVRSALRIEVAEQIL
jgi:hypothetical protein